MTLDIIENEIVLKDVALRPIQKSQLHAWGFRSVARDTLLLAGRSSEKILVKVVNYFRKENISCDLSEVCLTKINDITQRAVEFQLLKEKGANYKHGIYDTASFNEFSRFVEQSLQRTLKPHQLKAAFHLYLIKHGANFSVPGSGKTSVVLSVYEKLRSEGEANVLFVVGPPACFGPWKNEFKETLTRPLMFKVLAGGDRDMRKSEYFANEKNKAELYLTTFQTLLNDQSEITTFFSQKGISIFLAIDEAHYIKQINGNWASAVLNISKHAKFRCILTGTPIPKGFSDIYNLFDFLWPDYDAIEHRVRVELQTLERNNEIDEAKEILESRIGPLFYRVRKRDLELTEPKMHDPIMIQMNRYEQIIYDAIERNIRSYATTDYLRNVDFINRLKRGRLIRLRQCISYVHLLNSVIEYYDEDVLADQSDLRHVVRDYDKFEVPAKIEYLVQKLLEFKSSCQKVVVWTNFVGTIEKLEEYINQTLKLYCRSIYGKTPIEQTSLSEELTREQIRDEFVSETSGLDILIANPAACAESISLHKTCHHAIYYDLSYNCAQYLQSLDRIHRVGGSEKIEANYYFLQYNNSIDQDILNNVRSKATKMSRIIDEDYEIYSLDMFNEDEEIAAYDRIFGK